MNPPNHAYGWARGLLLRGPLVSLRFRDFRFLWAATMAMSLGFWMQQLTVGWLVLQLSDSPLMVGVAEAARLSPFLLFGLMAGTIADRLERRVILRIIVGANVLLSLGMGALEYFGLLSVPIAVVGAFLYGTANAFLMPTLQAFIHDIVGSRNVVNGLALNQFAQRLMGVFGGLLGGLLLARMGIGGTFIVMAIGYGASLVILTGVKARSNPGAAEQMPSSVWRSFAEGIGLMASNRSVRALLVLAVATEIFAFSYIVMLPIFARDILEIGESGLGVLIATRATGSMLGVAILAVVGNRLPRGRVLILSSALFGLSLAAFGSAPWFALALVALGFAGVVAAIFDTLQQAALQLAVGETQRGRAMGIWVMGVGAGPVGHLQVGGLAQATSAPFAIIFNGLALIVIVAGVAIMTPRLRRL